VAVSRKLGETIKHEGHARTKSSAPVLVIVNPHHCKAAEQSAGICVVLICHLEAHHEGVDNPEAGICDSGRRVEVTAVHDGGLYAQDIVWRAWTHIASM
jgi:hypothetical protein